MTAPRTRTRNFHDWTRITTKLYTHLEGLSQILDPRRAGGEVIRISLEKCIKEQGGWAEHEVISSGNYVLHQCHTPAPRARERSQAHRWA